MAATIKVNIDQDGDPMIEFAVVEGTSDLEKRLLAHFFHQTRRYGLEMHQVTFTDAAEQEAIKAEIRIAPRTL